MNDQTMLNDVVAQIKAVGEVAINRLMAHPHDPATLRGAIAALGQLEDALLQAGETATLPQCRGLAGVWGIVTQLRAEVLLHLHEVEARQTLFDVPLEAQHWTLH